MLENRQLPGECCPRYECVQIGKSPISFNQETDSLEKFTQNLTNAVLLRRSVTGIVVFEKFRERF